MTIQRPLDLPTARRRPRARRSRTKKRSARIPNRNAPPWGGSPRARSAVGTASVARAPRSLARPRTGRDATTVGAPTYFLLARRRPRIVRSAKGEPPREFSLLRSTFVPSFRARPRRKRFADSRKFTKRRQTALRCRRNLEISRNARRSCRSRPRLSLVFVGCSTHARNRVVRSRGARARAHPAGSHDTRPRRPRTSPSRGETRGSLRVRDVARDGGHDAEKEPVCAERYLSRSVRRSRASR